MVLDTACHDLVSRQKRRRGFSFCGAGGETGDETKRFTLRVGVSRYAPFSLAQIGRREHFRTRKDAMSIRYGYGMTGRAAGCETGREAGRRGDGETSRTEDGTEIAYPSDGKNVYEFRFD